MFKVLKYTSFYVFLFISMVAFFLYVYPRYEYDRKASAVAIGFEEAYTGEMIDFFTVTPIQNTGLSGERIVYVYDFSKIPLKDLEALLAKRKNQKVIFYETPYKELDATQFALLLDRYSIEVGFLELNPVSALVREALLLRAKDVADTVAYTQYEKVFRVHTVKPAEVINLGLDYKMVLRRWLRAKEERSIDFFWVQPLPDSLSVSYAEYGVALASFFNTSRTIVKEPVNTFLIFQIILIAGCICLIFFYSPFVALLCAVFLFIFGFSKGFLDMNLYLAGLTGTFGMAGIFRDLRKLDYNPTLKYAAMIVFSIFLGVTINALSFSYESVNGILLPHGVKLLLFYLPALVFLREFLYYGLKGLKGRLHWSDFVLVIGIGLLLLYSLMRSGNSAFVLNIERKLRDGVEMILGVRPRLREIIGIPCLWLYFRKKYLAFGRYSFLIPVAGAMGICSIVNSFQHVHTPIDIIFLRELLGIGIGTAIGIIIGIFLPTIEEGEEIER